MLRKQYNQTALESANTFEGSESSNIIYKRKLKLPIPKKGETEEGFSLVQVLLLPSAGESDTIMKPMVEVNILHKETGAFIGKYYVNEKDLDNDLASKTRWEIYNKAGKVSTAAFKNIRIANRDGCKKFVNVYVIAHPSPEEVGKVKLWCYGKKVSEIITAAIKGSAAFDYEAPVNIMSSPLRIIMPEGITAPSIYDKTKFVKEDENFVQSIYDKLDEDDLVDIDKLVAGELDTGNSINPPVEYVASLLQQAGYIGYSGDKKDVADLSSVSGVSLETPGLVDYSGFPDDEGFPN